MWGAESQTRMAGRMESREWVMNMWPRCHAMEEKGRLKETTIS